MAEETKGEFSKPIVKTEEPKKEDATETSNMIDTANEAAVRLEDANKEFKGLLDRQERMKVEQRMAGQTEAGQTQVKKEETPEEYANRILSGQ